MLTDEQLDALRAALASDEDIALVVDRDYRVLLANEAARVAYGWDGTAATTCYQLLWSASGPCGDLRQACPTKHALEAGQLGRAVMDWESGTPRRAQVSGIPVFGDGEEVEGCILILNALDSSGSSLAALRRLDEELAAIIAIGGPIEGEQPREEVLRLALQAVIALEQAEGGGVWLRDEPGEGMHLAVSQDLPEGALEGLRVLGTADEVVDYVLNAGFPKVVVDVATDPRPLRTREVDPGVRWLVGVPVRGRGAPVGVIGVFGRDAYRGQPRTMPTLSMIAYEAALAVERANLLARSERRAEQLAALAEVGRTLATKLDARAVLDSALDSICRRLGAVTAAVLLREEDNDLLVARAWWGLEKLPRRLRVARVGDRSLPGWIAGQRQAIAVSGAEASAGKHGFSYLEQFKEFHIVGAPLVYEERLLGVVIVTGAPARPFGAEERDFLSTFAGQVAASLESARLHEKERARSAELETMIKVGQELASSLELQMVLDSTLRAVSNRLGAEVAVLYLHEPESDELVAKAWLGAPEIDRAWRRLPRGQGVSWAAAERRAAIAVSDLTAAEHLPSPPAALVRGMRALYVPLFSGERLMGTATIGRRAPLPEFSAEEVRLFGAYADQAAVAIENALLHEQVLSMALTDDLTGLYNHRYFYQRLHEEMRRAARGRRGISVIFLDVDNMKGINDAHGHLLGDAVLRSVARQIKTQVRDTDVAARYGGDEFAVVLPEADAVQARGVADRIRAAMADARVPDERRRFIPVSVSQGVAALPVSGSYNADIVDLADRAAYASKRRGTGQISVYGEEDAIDAGR